MGLIDELRGSRICIDSAPFIYFIEKDPKYLNTIKPLFAEIDAGNIDAMTSTITLLEVLVIPFKTGNASLAKKYREILLNAEGFTTYEISHEIEEHPMFKRISMIEGSSVAPDIIAKVHEKARGKQRVLVCLDSDHTHDHVLAELNAYAPLVSVGSYCVVFDTVIEDMPEDFFPDRPWGKGNTPKTAVYEWLPDHPEFQIDKTIEHKLLITVAPDGYLRRVK